MDTNTFLPWEPLLELRCKRPAIATPNPFTACQRSFNTGPSNAV